MFTPEDELDALDEELGRKRRRLYDAERARHDGRACDYVQVDKTILRLRVDIERMERERAEMVADQLAADEAFGLDGAA